MIKSIFISAWRNLTRHKTVSWISITGLTIGMVCFIFISFWVENETHYDSFLPNSERIFRVILHQAGDVADPGVPSAPFVLPRILKENYPQIKESTQVKDRPLASAIRYGEKAFYEERFFFSDPSFFHIFKYHFLAGDPHTALASPKSVVVTQSAAKRYFGEKDPLGKTIRWNNEEDVMVTGVISDIPQNSHLRFDFMASLKLIDSDWSDWRRETAAYVLLQEGESREEVQALIAETILKRNPEERFKISLQSLSDAHLNLRHGGGNDRSLILIFTLFGLAILTIACINHMIISTGRASIRAKEVGIRKAVGASRHELTVQVLGETILQSFLSLVLSIPIVMVLFTLYNHSQSMNLSLSTVHPLSVFLFFLLVIIWVGIGAGIYPAWVLSSLRPAMILKSRSPKSGGSFRFLSLLVTTQFVAAVIMIILAILAQRQFDFIHRANLGFEREGTIHIQMNDAIRKKYDLFKKRLLSNPKILGVTASSARPHLLFNFNVLEWEGKDIKDPVEVNFLYLDHDYVKTFGLKILQGRDFSQENLSDATRAFIVNESALGLIGDREPLGKRIRLGSREGQVIGVVKDFNFTPLIFRVAPLVMAINPDWYSELMIKLAPGDTTKTLSFIEKVHRDLAAEFPFEYRFVDQMFNSIYRPLDFARHILDIITLIAISVSCLGLFGLVSLIAERRKREIGIRKVLGATDLGIVCLLSKKIAMTILTANGLAAPLAVVAANAFLNLFAYKTTLDPFIFIGAAGLTLLVALATIGQIVFRAARQNPVDSIKYE